VNYVGAGTVEFIVEQKPDGSMIFYFMEMNTRLQVEHPVTEAVTGHDLVEWQLRVACGERLPALQADLKIEGHAIEARICAENPDNNFLPATGKLSVLNWPDHVTFSRNADGVVLHDAAPVRVDAGVRAGDAISPFYDSMIAKLIVHGATREEALARMDAALAQTHIVGLNTNVQFLRYVVRSESFAKANLDTALIPREAAVLFDQEMIGLNLAVAAVVAQTLLYERSLAKADVSGWTDPWSQRDGWRSHGLTQRRFEFEFHAEKCAALLTYLHDGALQLALGDVKTANGEIAGSLLTFSGTGTVIDLQFAGQRHRVNVYRLGEVAHVFGAAGATQITVIEILAHAGDGAAETGRLTAPMPGKVVSFSVKAGDKVTKGQALAVMDAMKMEHTIAAPTDGVVGELLFAPGDQVAEGAELLKLLV
jgi:3-methylcrotonyl-CoA carboxylase alpha subunit